MGVLTHRIFVCGQLLLLSLVLSNITDAQVSQLSTAIAPPLNATGNPTENIAPNPTSNSTYNDSTATANHSTTQVTPIVSTNSTLGTTQSNLTVTGSAEQPNTTENAQTSPLATTSTVNISSTAVTSTDNRTASSTENATSSTAITASNSTTVSTTSQNSINFTESQGLTHSEKSLTILFSILLGVIVLVVLGHFAYKFGRNKERSVQYTHRRLQNEDTGEQFGVPDDTLVISGGLYDGPQIYNPTMTVQNEDEFQTEGYGFASRPTQFRLEFLREDQDRVFDNEASTFQTFHAHDQEP